MINQAAKKRNSRLAVKGRRREIEQRLSAYGLARGPRRLFSGESTADFAEARSRRLRAALEGLGPILSSFGLYLSSRADLWPAADCLELGTIVDQASATPANEVSRLLSRELDSLPEKIFSGFEAEPFESRLLFQSHYASLKNGTAVIVKIIHPRMERQLTHDLEILPRLTDSFAGCGLSDLTFKNVVADFSQSLLQQMDFVNQAHAFETLAQDAEVYDGLRVPYVYESLTTSRVLVIEKLSGLRLDHVWLSSGDSVNADGRRLLEEVGFEPNELARLLCEVWLRQALRGRVFPCVPRPENVVVLATKQIAFTGGGFAVLPPGEQTNLWNYLFAAADENSDKAVSYLLKGMKTEAVSDSEAVRHKFRQAMPFRDGGWDSSGNSQSLAELLFVQWRFARECGYVPLMHLPAFFRGLFSIADSARRLTSQVDPLIEGLRDMRLLTGLAEFREMISVSELTNQMDRYLALMPDLPERFDQVLSVAAEGGLQTKPGLADDLAHRRQKDRSTVVLALLLVLAILPLLSHQLAVSIIGEPWANRIGAALFLLLGAVVLRKAAAGDG
jgi:predicted unusual protein kinase regulating ubiquinone biosynthesis (AarF/ABC1/UbiB family)